MMISNLHSMTKLLGWLRHCLNCLAHFERSLSRCWYIPMFIPDLKVWSQAHSRLNLQLWQINAFFFNSTAHASKRFEGTTIIKSYFQDITIQSNSNPVNSMYQPWQ